MPSRKALKGVAHNFVESFTSLMNYLSNDYVMGHIVYTSWLTGATELNVDILNGIIQKSPLLTKPVVESIDFYIMQFPNFVNKAQSEISFIKKAELSIKVNPSIKMGQFQTKFHSSPYSCKLLIIDDRGKEYSYEKKDWWYPEKTFHFEDEKPYWKKLLKIFHK